MHRVRRQRPRTLCRWATTAARSCRRGRRCIVVGCCSDKTCDLVFADGGAAVAVAAAVLDLVLLDGGLLETGGVNLVAC